MDHNQVRLELPVQRGDGLKAQFHKLWGLAHDHDYQKPEWLKMQALLDNLPPHANAQMEYELAKRWAMDAPLRLLAQTITVREIEVPQTEPPTRVYNVEITEVSGCGVWMETLNTRLELRSFLRGLRVATSTVGGTFLVHTIWKFSPDSIINDLP